MTLSPSCVTRTLLGSGGVIVEHERAGADARRDREQIGGELLLAVAEVEAVVERVGAARRLAARDGHVVQRELGRFLVGADADHERVEARCSPRRVTALTA